IDLLRSTGHGAGALTLGMQRLLPYACLLLGALPLDGTGILFLADTNQAQELDDFALDIGQQLLEQIEGLALVFLLGVLAAVAAQADALAQAFHLGQMLFPESIENLQRDLLFEGPHVVADIGTLLLIILL